MIHQDGPSRRPARIQVAAGAALLCLLLGGAANGQGFADVTAASGLVVPPSLPFHVEGACAGDFDGDGDQDLVLPGAPGQPVRYFRNDGGLQFSDHTATAGLGSAPSAKGCAAADVDNDGDLDLFLANHHFADSLFINDGGGHFTDQAAARGVAFAGSSWCAAFGDFDRDGWIDLFLGTWFDASGNPAANRLYRNLGDGNFADVTGTAGVADPGGACMCATWVDQDEDGWPDLVIGNDKGAMPQLSPGSTWRNQRNGTFVNVGAATNSLLLIDAMGVDATDARNDGGWDLFLTDSPPDHKFLEWIPQTGAYVDRTTTFGVVGGPIQQGWSTHFLDADNDGWQDLYVVHNIQANHLYRNPGAGLWQQVAPAWNCAQTGGQRVALVADLDDDGGMDILNRLPLTGISLLANAPPAAAHWLKVATRGTVSNASGIGAVVRVEAGGSVQRQYVRSGTGYLGGSDLRCHFGLGASATAARVSVRWPSGVEQVFENVPADQVLVAVEPSLSLQAPPVGGTSPQLVLSVPGDAGLPFLAALALQATPGIPLPDGRVVPLAPDPLLALSLQPNPFLWPALGTLANPGASAGLPLHLPPQSSLVGFAFHVGAVTLHPQWPSGVKTIPRALRVVIQ